MGWAGQKHASVDRPDLALNFLPELGNTNPSFSLVFLPFAKKPSSASTRHGRELQELRWDTNPYVYPRDATDHRFHSLLRQDFYETVIYTLDKPVLAMKTVDWDAIRRKDISGIGEPALKHSGDFHLATFRMDWCDEAIMQFYAT